jgi:hypothetical protein
MNLTSKQPLELQMTLQEGSWTILVSRANIVTFSSAGAVVTPSACKSTASAFPFAVDGEASHPAILA